MAKHITALALLLAAVSFFFLVPGPKHSEQPDADGAGKSTVSSPKNPKENSSKLDKIKEDNKVLAEDDSAEESDSSSESADE